MPIQKTTHALHNITCYKRDVSLHAPVFQATRRSNHIPASNPSSESNWTRTILSHFTALDLFFSDSYESFTDSLKSLASNRASAQERVRSRGIPHLGSSPVADPNIFASVFIAMMLPIYRLDADYVSSRSIRFVEYSTRVGSIAKSKEQNFPSGN